MLVKLGSGDERKDVGDEFGPVVDAGGHVAGEDPVEFGGMDPGVFDVVDFELDVWGRERGLVGAEVVADDLGWEVRNAPRGCCAWGASGLRWLRESRRRWRWPLFG